MRKIADNVVICGHKTRDLQLTTGKEDREQLRLCSALPSRLTKALNIPIPSKTSLQLSGSSELQTA